MRPWPDSYPDMFPDSDLVRYFHVTDEVSVRLQFVAECLSTLLTAEIKPEVVLFLAGRGTGRRNEGKDRSVLVGKLNPDHMLPVLRRDLFGILRSGSNSMELLRAGEGVPAPGAFGGYV